MGTLEMMFLLLKQCKLQHCFLVSAQVDFFDPAKAATSGGASAGLAALFGPAEAVAAEAAADTMQELQKGATGALPAVPGCLIVRQQRLPAYLSRRKHRQ